MLRIIIGVLTGFIVWSILWVGSDQMMMQSIGWYGDHQRGFERAFVNKEPFTADLTILILNIVRSIIASLIAGYVAGLIANKSVRTTTTVLGIALLLFGIMVEAIAWGYLPLWYHIIFLVLLIPMTIAGGKLVTTTRDSRTA